MINNINLSQQYQATSYNLFLDGSSQRSTKMNVMAAHHDSTDANSKFLFRPFHGISKGRKDSAACPKTPPIL